MKQTLIELKSFLDDAIANDTDQTIVESKLKSVLIELNNANINLTESAVADSVYSYLFDSIPKLTINDPENDQKLIELFDTLTIIRAALSSFSSGDLSYDFKLKGFLGGSLKMLQSNLRHLTWQTQMVAQGDFTQRVEFMGDFSGAFNQMVQQLDETIQTLKNRETELVNLNATKDKFFSIISHDLRGPLGSLKTLLDLMIDDFDSFTPEETVEYLSLLSNSAKNIFSLLENLLIWSRAQQGLIELNPSLNDVHSVSADALDVLKLQANTKKIALINNIKPKTLAYFDINLLTTVIRNLTSNSIKFTPENGSITLSCVQTSDSPDFVTISVTDTGVGMTQEILYKLFRIDVTVTNTGTSGEKGTGLGLILCKEFVEKMSGKIWVESEIGKGSTFSFTLPKMGESGISI